MVQTLADQLQQFTGGGKRPLASLSKEQLFKYPDADPTEEGYWKFTVECIIRRGIDATIKSNIARLEKNVDLCHKELFLSSTDDKRKANEKRLEWAKGELARETAKTEEAAIVNKSLRQFEIVKYFREKHIAEYRRLAARYDGGVLFLAQNYGFVTFLQADQKEINLDNKVFEELQSLAMLSCEEESEKFRGIHYFYSIRIFPPAGMRRRFLGEDGQPANQHSLPEAVSKKYKQWFRSYNMATLNNGWQDASGVAHDVRIFDPAAEA